MLLGTVVLIGWIGGVGILTTLLPGLVAMRPVTATCLVLLGLALLTVVTGAPRRWAVLPGLAVAAIGAVSLVSIVSDRPLGVDQLPWPGLYPASYSLEGNMSLAAAVALLFLGLAYVARAWGMGRGAVTALTVAPLVITALALLGYLYDVQSLYALWGFTSIALHTSAGILMAAVGLHLVTRGTRVRRLFRGASPGGALERRILPVVLVVLPLLGWLVGLGVRQGHYDSQIHGVLVVIVAAGVVTLASGRAARVVETLDAERRVLVREVEEANDSLHDRVASRTRELESANASLRTSEHRFHAVFDAAPVTMVEQGLDGTITLANQRWSELFGSPAEEAVGLRTPPHVHQDDAVTVASWFTSDLPDDMDGSAIEFRLLIPGTPQRHVLARRRAVLTDGVRAGWVVTLKDITETFRAQRRDRTLRLIGDEVHHGTDVQSIVDATTAVLGKVFGASHVFVVMSADEGISTSSSWAASPGKALPADAAVGVLEHLVGSAQGESAHGPVPDVSGASEAVRRALGGSGIVTFARYRTALEGGQAVAMAVCQDQDRSWTEEDLEILAVGGREVSIALTRAISHAHQRDLAERLSQLDESKNEFIASVTHELRTPLTSIVGYCDLLLDGDAGEVSSLQRGMLDTIRRNGGRMSAFVDDLLALSKLESWDFEEQYRPVHVIPLVEEAVSSLIPTATAKGLELTTDLPQRLPALWAHVQDIEQIVRNLLSNAVKFTPAGGTVTVRAAMSGETVVIEVEDTGMGIPADEVDRLFVKFFRASNAEKNAVQGTGLGLAIVQRIVAGLGGSVEVRSVLDEGTTFTVTLPYVPEGSQDAESDRDGERPAHTAV